MALQYAAIAPQALYVEDNPDFEFLDIAMAKLNSGLVEQGMNLLVSELTNLYTTTSTSAWEHALKKTLLNHPIIKILLQDPLTYRSEEHTSELQSHCYISYAVFCLKKKKK